jgi:hypothetical protein
MYQLGSAILINGQPIPEPGTIGAALLMGGLFLVRRRRRVSRD